MSIIRKMVEKDRSEVVEMMGKFYSSPAVLGHGTKEIFDSDVTNCVSNSPYLDGYVIEEKGVIIGYAMVAKSFSTELGKQCIWLEDLYIKDEYQGKGIGKSYFEFVEKEYKNCIFRLEVEKCNANAIKLYDKSGYSVVEYQQMRKSF